MPAKQPAKPPVPEEKPAAAPEEVKAPAARKSTAPKTEQPKKECKVKRIHGGIPIKEKLFFAKNLSIMINAGIPLRDALSVIKDQTAIRKFRFLLEQVICEVENGQYFSVALSKYPKIFDHLFVNLVRVGEESGQLAENLSYIATQLERSDALKKKIRGALVYPAIILLGTIGVAGYLTFVTLPQLLPIFTSLKVTLPPTTQFLFDFSHFVTNNILYIAGGVLLAIIAIRLILLVKPIKFFFHRLSLTLPIFGELIKYAQITRLAQILSTLLVAGVDIVHALDITAESMSNLVFREELLRVSKELRQEGVDIADCLAKTKGVFPPMVIQMIRVGEKTGKLDELFRYIAEFFTKEIDAMVSNMTTIIEPVLLLVMGLVVGFIAVSIITPIYKLTEGVHR